MRKAFVLILILFLWINAKAQSLPKSVTLLQSKLNASKTDTSKISILIQLGNLYNDLNKKDERIAVDYYQKALLLSKKINSFNWINKSVALLVSEYAQFNEFKKCRAIYLPFVQYYNTHGLITAELAFLDMVKDAANNGTNNGLLIRGEWSYILELKEFVELQIKDTLNAIKTLKDEGDNNLNLGKLDLAKNQLLEVVKRYKAIHFRKIHDTYYLLWAVSQLKGDEENELYYGLEMVKGMLATHDSVDYKLFYMKLGETYTGLKMYEESIACYKKILALTDESSKNCYDSYYAIAVNLIALNKPYEASQYLLQKKSTYPPKQASTMHFFYKAMAKCYQALHQNQLEEKNLLAMIKSEDFSTYGIVVKNQAILTEFLQISQFYITIKNFSKAKYYVNRASIMPSIGKVSLASLSTLELCEFKVDSAYNNYTSAIQHFQTYKKINDSVFNSTKIQQIQNLQIKYESSQKDQDINILKSQAQVSKANLEKRRLTGNLLLGGSILLLLLLVLVYNRYRLKQRNLLLLEGKQTEISKKNQALEQLLKENEWLLKEVHHRVKNNLHLIVSLLNSQSKFLKDEAALTAVMDSQHRVQAMSLIHQKLYKTNNTSSIYMPEYIGELLDYLKDSFKTGHKISFLLDVAPIKLDVLQAVPLGLILNETITNCIKYAFPFSENDTIKIKLADLKDGKICLIIADNGCGLPDNFSPDNSDSFGLLLVHGLIEDLGGLLHITNYNGTSIKITFNTEQNHR